MAGTAQPFKGSAKERYILLAYTYYGRTWDDLVTVEAPDFGPRSRRKVNSLWSSQMAPNVARLSPQCRHSLFT